MLTVRPYQAGDEPAFLQHYHRSFDESGDGEPLFNPYAPDDPDRPDKPRLEALELALDEPGWLRVWVVDGGEDRIVGHLNLKGHALKLGLHRCLLGIAIERDHRGAGIGTALMQAAIEFGKGQPGLAWIDLSVFSHNQVARKLYTRLGFVETGRIVDCFRLGEQSITDIHMALKLR